MSAGCALSNLVPQQIELLGSNLQRQNEISEGYRQVFANYHRVLQMHRQAISQVETLSKELGELKAAKKVVEEEYTAYRASGVAGHLQQGKTAELEARIASISEELNAALKAKGQNDQKFIDLHSVNDTLREKVQTSEAEIQRLLNLKAQLEADKSKLTTDFENTEHRLSLLMEETRSREQQMKDDQRARQTLQEENHSLLQRLMSQKTSDAEVINSMTELNQSQSLRIKELEAELELCKQQPQLVGSEQQMIENLRKVEKSGLSSAWFDTRPPVAIRKTIEVHSGEVNAVSYDMLGTTFATAGNDKSVRLFDSKTLELQHAFMDCTSSIVRLCFSLAGDLLLAGCNDGICLVYNVPARRKVHSLTGHSEKVWACGFLGDNKHIATGSYERTVRWWDLGAGGKCFKTSICHSACNDLCTIGSPDTLATVHVDKNIRIWDPRQYQIVETIEDAHDQQVTSVTCSPDQGCILTTGREGLLKMFDLRSYKATHVFQHPEFTAGINHYKACFSPDGRFVACGANGRAGESASQPAVVIWDSKTTRPAGATLKHGHTAAITGCAWSPEGKEIVSVSHDRKVVVWM